MSDVLEQFISMLFNIVAIIATVLFFAVLPLILLVGFCWGFSSFTGDYFYTSSSWIMPVLIIISMFLGGVMVRAWSDRYRVLQGLKFFILGALSLIFAAYVLWVDIDSQPVISQLLPHPLDGSLIPLLYSMPGIGMLGMIFSKTFRPSS